MSKLAMLFLLILWGGAEVHSQESGSSLLRGASHCLAVEDVDWLAIRSAHVKLIRTSYISSIEPGSGERHIYVIAYGDTRRSNGKIFDLIYQRKGHETLFDVQNNASFIWSGNHVNLVDPPLGGTWTQTHLLTAVKDAGRQSITQFSVKDLYKPVPNITCRSYLSKK